MVFKLFEESVRVAICSHGIEHSTKLLIVNHATLEDNWLCYQHDHSAATAPFFPFVSRRSSTGFRNCPV